MSNFEHSPAPDGIHETIAFNEYRSPRWWSARRHREWLLDKVAPWIFAAMLFRNFRLRRLGGRSMVAFHKDFAEYATCAVCGLKKLCGKVGRHMVCWSCSQKNFNGLRNYNKELINDDA